MQVRNPRDALLFVQFRPLPTSPHEWAALVEFVRAEGIGLIVIDTLSRCWPVWGVDPGSACEVGSKPEDSLCRA